MKYTLACVEPSEHWNADSPLCVRKTFSAYNGICSSFNRRPHLLCYTPQNFDNNPWALIFVQKAFFSGLIFGSLFLEVLIVRRNFAF